jgi:hypothetical protein
MRYREDTKDAKLREEKTSLVFLRATSRPSRLRGKTLWVAGKACAGLLRGKSFRKIA